MNPELARQFGDRPIALDRRQRHLRLERRVVLLPCPLHVLLLRLRRFLGAGLHLSLLSHFRGPPHSERDSIPSRMMVWEKVAGALQWNDRSNEAVPHDDDIEVLLRRTELRRERHPVVLPEA